ncbi:MarR family winged helix-turn-helix transcriptional regulator [Sphingobium algorifonticola]|uniref:MarR family transcriptional regulator n=1 Tax=Sphingobium algorifonticola TaxID=2008318 RepID=A0A437J9S5_9SPHN|nr:MarR family transcriptional regulator [Sphingobium algorifonticola]RVT42266.1 MarR family transcriptional regulator [Sphingobium algorifonticola]
MNDIADAGEAHVPLTEKYGGGESGPMSVRTWLRMLSCSMIVEKRLRRRFIEHYGTTLPRFDVLAALDRRPDGITMGELSQMLLVSNGNVTALVRQLQGDGHVTLQQDPDDRRSLIVQLTTTGAAHFAELAAAHHGWIADMFKGVSGDQQRALYDLLSVVKTSIAAESRDR